MFVKKAVQYEMDWIRNLMQCWLTPTWWKTFIVVLHCRLCGSRPDQTTPCTQKTPSCHDNRTTSGWFRISATFHHPGRK